MQKKFTVLIGSCARGTHGPTSDLDVVRVGHDVAIPRSEFCQAAVALGPMTFIDYDEAAFLRLYEQGSLFLHHIFHEGVLVRGSDKDWRILRSGFSVRRDFSDEIEENVELYNWLNDPAQFENAEYPLLSHMFRVLKNLSIFALAQKQIYIFEKRDALAKFLPGVAIDDIDLLIKANVAFERNQSNANIAASKLAQRSIYDLFGRIDFELRKALLA